MKKKYIKIIILTLILALFIGTIYYLNDYYKSTDEVQEYLNKEGTVEVLEIDDGLFLDGYGTEDAIIFYPGAKVEYTAYLPLLYELADNGVDVFLLQMPFNIAFFGTNEADDIIENYSYTHYYLAGHSLGGVVASSFVYKHLDNNNIEGLILLASYSTNDLSNTNLNVLSIYGSNDGVLNINSLEENKKNLPNITKEIVIDGGNHAQFGCYGKQKGDNDATISALEQRTETVDEILKIINKN